MDKTIAFFLAYTLAYILVTLVDVYVLNLPGWITEEYGLVKEFYIKNGAKNIFIEWFVLLVYIGTTHLIVQKYKIKDNAYKLGVMAAVTLSLSGLASLLFVNTPALRNTFFYRWFKQTGFKTLVYDVIIISSIYVVFHKILCKFKYHNLL